MKIKCVTCERIGNETNKLKLHGVWVCNRFQCIITPMGQDQPRLLDAWEVVRKND